MLSAYFHFIFISTPFSSHIFAIVSFMPLSNHFQSISTLFPCHFQASCMPHFCHLHAILPPLSSHFHVPVQPAFVNLLSVFRSFLGHLRFLIDVEFNNSRFSSKALLFSPFFSMASVGRLPQFLPLLFSEKRKSL